MKKSKVVSLVLLTAALSACQNKKEDEWGSGRKKVYMRSDTTAQYSRTRHSGGAFFYAFRPYYSYGSSGVYSRGYYSNRLSHRSNVGTNSFKSTISRGGFGSSVRSASS